MNRFLLFFGFVFSIGEFCFSAEIPYLDDANALYVHGEQAQTWIERKKFFNQALLLYLKVETESSPLQGSSMLNAAIANSFFQLGEYAWAILYYSRALSLAPLDHEISERLILSQKKLNIIPENPLSFFQRILSFNGFINVPQRWQFLFYFLMASFLFSFVMIFTKKSRFIRALCYFCLFSSSFFLLNLICTYYFIPLKGILITPTGIYRSPEPNVQLTFIPLREGSQLQVLDVEKNGTWLKIKDRNGMVGYVPFQTIRII